MVEYIITGNPQREERYDYSHFLIVLYLGRELWRSDKLTNLLSPDD